MIVFRPHYISFDSGKNLVHGQRPLENPGMTPQCRGRHDLLHKCGNNGFHAMGEAPL
jgi:hypothetical protein